MKSPFGKKNDSEAGAAHAKRMAEAHEKIATATDELAAAKAKFDAVPEASRLRVGISDGLYAVQRWTYHYSLSPWRYSSLAWMVTDPNDREYYRTLGEHPGYGSSSWDPINTLRFETPEKAAAWLEQFQRMSGLTKDGADLRHHVV